MCLVTVSQSGFDGPKSHEVGSLCCSTVMSTWSNMSPSASRSIDSTSARVVPGTVRMSTSMSTTSGIVLVFCPPCATLGENVVCVSAWHVRATGTGRVSSVAMIVSLEARPSLSSSGRCIAAT